MRRSTATSCSPRQRRGRRTGSVDPRSHRDRPLRRRLSGARHCAGDLSRQAHCRFRVRCRRGGISSRVKTDPRDKALGSANGVSPQIISAIKRPLTGPCVKPWCWWPKSNHKPRCRGAGPITGSMSGKQGRAPIHGSASRRSASGNSLRAIGSTLSSCTGVFGASRRANSTPVVRRMPRVIGASK